MINCFISQAQRIEDEKVKDEKVKITEVRLTENRPISINSKVSKDQRSGMDKNVTSSNVSSHRRRVEA